MFQASALLHEPRKIIGAGQLDDELQHLVDELDAPVELMGALPHAEVPDRITSSRVGVLAARHGRSGDEDGLPVVLLEFMRAGVPVVSTPVAGIPTLLRRAGTLTVEDDEVALAAAIRNAELASGQPPKLDNMSRSDDLRYEAYAESAKLSELLRLDKDKAPLNAR